MELECFHARENGVLKQYKCLNKNTATVPLDHLGHKYGPRFFVLGFLFFYCFGVIPNQFSPFISSYSRYVIF